MKNLKEIFVLILIFCGIFCSTYLFEQNQYVNVLADSDNDAGGYWDPRHT